MARLISRRNFLDLGARMSVAGLLTGAAFAANAADKACADAGHMDDAARSMRGALNYTEASADPDKACSLCAFFQSPADGCGTCQLLNGPVNAKGHCDSWGAKS